jgi:uncharacterized membrane protein
MTTTSPGKSILHYKMHWHVPFTHFPVSFFVGSFGFILLSLFTDTDCFEIAGFIGLAAGAAVMIPTTLTGWVEWKGRYKGFKSKLFINKIRISFAMIGISFALVIYRATFLLENLNILHNVWHAIYFAGVTLLVIGSIAEGHYGARLNHR